MDLCTFCQTPVLPATLLKHLQKECKHTIALWKQTTLMELAEVGIDPVYWHELAGWFYKARIEREKEWNKKRAAVQVQRVMRMDIEDTDNDEAKAMAIFKTYNCPYRPLSETLDL